VNTFFKKLFIKIGSILLLLGEILYMDGMGKFVGPGCYIFLERIFRSLGIQGSGCQLIFIPC